MWRRLARWFVLVAALVSCDDGGDGSGGATSASTTAAAPTSSPTTAAATGPCRSSPDDAVDEAATVTLGPSPGIEATTAAGQPLLISGTVFDEACAPLAGASLDVWQTDGDGVYGPGHDTDELQCCYLQGTVRTDANGRYELATVMPGHYRGEREPPPAHIHVEANHPSGGNAMLEIVFAGDPQLALPAADGYVVATLTGDDDAPRRGVADLVLSGAATAPAGSHRRGAAATVAAPGRGPPGAGRRDAGRSGVRGVAGRARRLRAARRGGVPDRDAGRSGTGGSCCGCTGSRTSGRRPAISAPDIRRVPHRPGLRVGRVELQQHVVDPRPRRRRDRGALGPLRRDRTAGPDRTYVIGLSMGGAAGHIAAERYADRFDGVLALCGAAGATPGLTRRRQPVRRRRVRRRASRRPSSTRALTSAR